MFVCRECEVVHVKDSEHFEKVLAVACAERE